MNLEAPDFKRVFRGYDSDEVDQAWAENERQLSEANAVNKELRLQINSLREQNLEWGNRLKDYEQIEKDLRDALVSAQRIAKQVKEDAAKQAEELLQSTRNESETILKETTRLKEAEEMETETLLIEKRKEIVQLEAQIQELTEQKAELQTIVEQAVQYLDMIKDLIK
ncbi:DivIVA domain-containing protein [Desulfosporosinus youngiae]|uniref:DivIVA domain-containing protein n=1 Tax=Desulfosporosinus youngiae TaxID=339862 RepID=UPI003D0781CF